MSSYGDRLHIYLMAISVSSMAFLKVQSDNHITWTGYSFGDVLCNIDNVRSQEQLDPVQLDNPRHLHRKKLTLIIYATY